MSERIPIAPFLAWCERREAQIANQLDRYPALGVNPDGMNPHARLMLELGWTPDTGGRRLLRWASDHATGMEDRAIIEDALHHAGAAFNDVYPDITDSSGYPCRVGQGRLMTDTQIRAAHIIYERTGLSLLQLGGLLWERYGYANVDSCTCGLRHSFKNLGLPVRAWREASIAAHYKHGLAVGGKTAPLYKRHLKIQRHGQCDATRSDGTPCPRAAQPGTTHCGYHAPQEHARRLAQIQQINARRAQQPAERIAA